MNELWQFLDVGFWHILDIQAYDHIVFLLALLAVFTPRQWKSLLICLTAFTIGHSLTLILAVLEVFTIQDPGTVELLIPVTILLTAIVNTFERSDARQYAFSQNEKPTTFTIRYLMALVFGLVHGLGFSGYLRSLLGAQEDLTLPLLGFNLGIELGQIAFTFVVMVFAFVFLTMLNKPKYHWNLLLSGAAMGISLMLLLDMLV